MWLMESLIDWYLFNTELTSKFPACSRLFDRKKHISGLPLMMSCLPGRSPLSSTLGDRHEPPPICRPVVWLGEGGKKGRLWLPLPSRGKLLVLSTPAHTLTAIPTLAWERRRIRNSRQTRVDGIKADDFSDIKTSRAGEVWWKQQ